MNTTITFAFCACGRFRADGEHYKKIYWLTLKKLRPGMYDVIREPLVSGKRFFLLLLHMKLGLVEQLVKALDFEEVFLEIRSVFSRLSDAKI